MPNLKIQHSFFIAAHLSNITVGSVVLDAPFSPHSDIFAVYRSISNLPSPPLTAA